MLLRHRNVLPRLRLLLMVDSKPSIAIRQQLPPPPGTDPVRHVLRDHAGHQLRLAQGQLVAAIDLPEVVRLAVQADEVLHLGRLGGRPDGLRRARRRRHDQHAAHDLVVVRVPQLALLLRQVVVEPRRDHVLDTDQPGAGVCGIVDEALSYVYQHHINVSHPGEGVGGDSPSVKCEQ